ncbi:MAG: hypothetical protein FWE68_06920, partial [Defluviitaleaceae bacterium]|nr:hypothetical protein [Defluviitaleaceae bacterium]
DNTLIPVYDDEGTYFIEMDDEGVPLGEWSWDDDELMWIFDQDTPLGEWTMPMTGEVMLTQYLILLGAIMIGLGIVLKLKMSSMTKRFKFRYIK